VEIVNIKINKLKPYEKNAKTHPKENIEAIKKSIEKYGFADPIGVWGKQNIIVEGHGRYLACKELGMDEVPCIRLDHLTDEERREYTLLHNKTTMMSDFDLDVLGEELLELDLSEFELDWGLPEIAEEKEVVEDDFDCTPPEQPKAKLGDIYQLGNHRLMCGDSTKEEDVAKLMNGNKADMVFTDPPYNLETKGGCKGEIGKALRKQGNDIEFIADFNPTEFLKVMPNFFNKNTLNSYIFCNKELLPTYLNWAVENKYSFNVLVWKKPNAIPIGDSHRPDIEYLLLFRKNAIWNNGLKDVNYSRCLEFSRETGLHPTMKPIKLITNELEISSNKNSIVLDFFGGSGSTLIACEQLNRKCYMMELDPKYVDVIIARWEQLTGKKAEKLN
jgi:site-specific DNA-methyltransferase (adenine-specific)